ncbi:hypothetical protein [Cupriavidus pauculus]|uniref:hypothetical protein n=1 Tax=Cupriavidus pauculus TaxID=82633 RepID=UPI00385779B1
MITLAGAADVILSRLVLKSGRENFTDVIVQMEAEKGKPAPTRTEAGKAVNDMLLINALKHFDRGESGIVEVDDLEGCAFAAILKALVNYVDLAGKNDEWVKAFLMWVRSNMDGTKYNINCDPGWTSSSAEEDLGNMQFPETK